MLELAVSGDYCRTAGSASQLQPAFHFAGAPASQLQYTTLQSTLESFIHYTHLYSQIFQDNYLFVQLKANATSFFYH